VTPDIKKDWYARIFNVKKVLRLGKKEIILIIHFNSNLNSVYSKYMHRSLPYSHSKCSVSNTCHISSFLLANLIVGEFLFAGQSGVFFPALMTSWRCPALLMHTQNVTVFNSLCIHKGGLNKEIQELVLNEDLPVLTV
jgi:hypothetical protein